MRTQFRKITILVFNNYPFLNKAKKIFNKRIVNNAISPLDIAIVLDEHEQALTL